MSTINFQHANDARHVELFATLAETTRCFVRLAEAASHQEPLMAHLDSCLEKGWMLRTQFAIGSAGALGFSLTVVSPMGQVVEIVNLDAPPSAQPFRLDGAKAAS